MGDVTEMMPVLGKTENTPSEVPFALLDRGHAQRIHSQTLEGLRSRGGLCIQEIAGNMKRLDYFEITKMSEAQAVKIFHDVFLGDQNG